MRAAWTALDYYIRLSREAGHKVPGPFGPGETPTSFVMRILLPQKQGADSR